MGWKPINGKQIKLNGAFYTNLVMLKFVVASAAEAKLGALFHNCQDGLIFRQTLAGMGHPQPTTPVYWDYAMAVCISNNTIKRQRSGSMEMRHFWVGDKEAQDMYALSWHPGQENLADYQSKHHIGAHHLAVHSWYLHMNNSTMEIPRALQPSALKGCVGTLQNGYLRKVPLPRVPHHQSTSPAAVAATLLANPTDTHYSLDPRIPL